MFDTQRPFGDSAIRDVIGILAANGDSGRLQITAGTTEGALFFKNGQLVDARVGDLTGFPAINAAASMRDARFSFDPSVAPPLLSSITPNERIVLKQFFGIETVDPRDAQETRPYSDVEQLIADHNDEVTLETPIVRSDELRTPLPYMLTSRSLYRGGLVLAVLFILIAVAAVAMRNRFRERQLPASVATTTAQPPAPVIAEPPVVAERRAVAEPVKAVKADAVKADDRSTPVGKDLTGKWIIVNTVQKTSYRSFENLKIGFDLSIDQTGKSFTGTGAKVSENGRSLPASSRTPIQVKGSINGDRVEATFFEEGAVRKTNGRFVWRIDRASGGLTGTFVSTAARTSGKSAARREL